MTCVSACWCALTQRSVRDLHVKRTAVVIPELPYRILNGLSQVDWSKLQIHPAYAAIFKQVLDQQDSSGPLL